MGFCACVEVSQSEQLGTKLLLKVYNDPDIMAGKQSRRTFLIHANSAKGSSYSHGHSKLSQQWWHQPLFT